MLSPSSPKTCETGCYMPDSLGLGGQLLTEPILVWFWSQGLPASLVAPHQASQQSFTQAQWLFLHIL